MVGAIFGTSSVQPGAVNVQVLAVAVVIVVATAVAFIADRSGRPWGRGLGIAIGIILIGLGAAGEWFFWIGALEGASHQKIGPALLLAAVGGVAAASTGVLATHGRGRASVAALVLATVLLPAAVGQAMVWSSQQPSVAEPTPSVPSQVADREPLSSCGEEATPPDGPGPAEAAARQCLLDAFQRGTTAELRWDYDTAQGDPVTELLRVLPDRSVEVFVDATRDRNGSGAWERRICDGLTPVTGAAVFELIGCGEASILQ